MTTRWRLILFFFAAAVLGWLTGRWILTLGFSGAMMFVLITVGSPLFIVLAIGRGGALCSLVFNLMISTAILHRKWVDPAFGPATEAPFITFLYLVAFLGAAPVLIASFFPENSSAKKPSSPQAGMMRESCRVRLAAPSFVTTFQPAQSPPPVSSTASASGPWPA